MDEANNQILRIERDLTRVRGVRDELHFEIQNRKAREDETLHSAREISEIADFTRGETFMNAGSDFTDADYWVGERG